MAIIKGIRPWQATVLVVVLLAASVATYGVYNMVNDAGSTGLQEGQQSIPVQRGDLINQVSTNGSLVFPNKEPLIFGSQGTVGQVSVEEGDTVVQGQLLASLDGASKAALERAAAQARVDLRDAQDLLDEIANGPDIDELQSAEDSVTSAQKDLDSANGDLKLVNREWEGKLETAQEARDNSQEEYLKPFQKWLGFTPNADQARIAPQDLLDALGIDLNALYDPRLRFSDLNRNASAEGMPPDDPATPWNESLVYTWLNIFPGSIVVTCDNGVPFQGACIHDEMTTPWDALSMALEALDTTQTQATGAIAKAENAASAAERALEKAIKSLDDLTAGTDELMLALRQADVAEAQSALDTALQNLEDVTIYAPFDGIVSRVNIEDGAQVGSDALAIEIVDPSVIEMDGSVDEIDVLFIQTGALATVTLDALLGQVLAGEVSTIGSAGAGQQGIVTYPVGIRLQVPPGVDLREGLTATASIVLRQESNVLLVPLQAIHGTFQEPTVMVVNNGSIEERPVLLGNSDDFWVVVSGGLEEGRTDSYRIAGYQLARLLWRLWRGRQG